MSLSANPGGSGTAGGKMADLKTRVASALVMGALAIGALLSGGDVFLAFWLIAGLVVFYEWQSIIGGPSRPARLAAGMVAIVAAAVFARQMAIDRAALSLLAGAAALAWLGGAGARLWSAFGVVYAGAFVAAVICLRLSLDGIYVITWLFALVWGTDVMAYFGGRMIGGPKLWPRVSPGKTWSGFLVGVTCGAALGLLALLASGGLARGAWIGVLATGLCAAALSQGGDLFESAVKRRFGVKDSSQMIPGHGGFMDRLDGFIAAAVFVAIVGGLRTGPLELAIGVLRW